MFHKIGFTRVSATQGTAEIPLTQWNANGKTLAR